MVDLFRLLSGLAWALVLLYTAQSGWRVCLRHARHHDHSRIYAFFFSILQSGYFLRFSMGHAPDIAPGQAYTMSLGLLVLSTLIAGRILHVRIDIDGWSPWTR